METNGSKTWKQTLIGVLALAVVAALVTVGTRNWTQIRKSQTTFQSPAEAAAALVKAAKDGNDDALAKILGVDAKALLITGNADADKAAMQAFVTKYEKMNRWVDMTDGSRVLYIGKDNFAFPVPLAKNSSGQWYFDAVAGAQEIRAREIGRNELLAIDACSAIANAQMTYFANGGESGEYAQLIISSSGKQDGLYWPVSGTDTPSPLAKLSEVSKSSVVSISPGQPLVIDGYSLRILTAQGDDAPGGTRNYLVNGRMTDGFAILATPVKYGETGIMTFMAGPAGAVFERDLGPDTIKTAAAIQEFDPDDDWSQVEQL